MRVGTSFRNSGGKLGALNEIILHPRWDPSTFDFDIAVVRICNCFDYTPGFYRVDMMPANAFLPDGTIGTVTGYGWLSVSRNTSPASCPSLTVISHSLTDRRSVCADSAGSGHASGEPGQVPRGVR